ncbi:MAG: O-methyltransferase [Treponema sp.]|nr:O-methyltransferase [Treponema sp.]
MEELKDIKTYAKKNSIPIMRDGGVDFICNYIKEHHIKNILEIGTAIGYSSIEFAKVSDDIKVTTIEIDIDRVITAKQNISDLALDQRITVINANALQVEIDGLYDLIFIDGPKAQYIKFFEKFSKNLAEDGVIISDNLSFHGMVEDLSLTHNYSTIKLVKKIRKYIDFLKNNLDFQTEFFECGDGISVSKRKKA